MDKPEETNNKLQTNKLPVGKQQSFDQYVHPKQYLKYPIKTNSPNPIVVAMDVTGSMSDWSATVMLKIKMLYGLLSMSNSVKDPEMSFCAVGDIKFDDAPLQVMPFRFGKYIDEYLVRMYMEGGGGTNHQESYELAAYFFNNHVKLYNPKSAFFFIIGDEGYYEQPDCYRYSSYLSSKIYKVDGSSEIRKLTASYNVFLIRKEHPDKDQYIVDQWAKVLGSYRILKIGSAKSCVDTILGAIALTTGSHTLETYKSDLEDRGQSEYRIVEIIEALRTYSEAIKSGKTKVILHS